MQGGGAQAHLSGQQTVLTGGPEFRVQASSPSLPACLHQSRLIITLDCRPNQQYRSFQDPPSLAARMRSRHEKEAVS